MKFRARQLVSRLVERRNRPVRKRRLALEWLESRQVLSTLYVSDAGDTGAGTLRDAITQANGDTSIDAIVINDGVGPIQLDSSLAYSGTQDLSITGNGTIIEPSAGNENSFDLLDATGGANLALHDLVFQNGLDGILVDVPTAATGTLSLLLDNVTVQGNSQFGVDIEDASSDAGILLNMSQSTVTGNGMGAGVTNGDGVRVDEGGAGGIVATLNQTDFTNNGGDGLNLNEQGDGGVMLTAQHSNFNNNGAANGDDLDGLHVDEAGAGNLWAAMVDASFSNNAGDGLNLNEAGDGSAYLWLNHAQANGNQAGAGIAVSEQDAGNLSAMLVHVTADGNNMQGVDLSEAGDGNLAAMLVAVEANDSVNSDGIALSEQDAGDLFAMLVHVTANGNNMQGVDVSEAGDGSLRVKLVHTTTENNGANGINLAEAGAGNLAASAVGILSTGNTDAGIKATQEVVGSDTGVLRLRNSTLDPNGNGPLDLTGVDVVSHGQQNNAAAHGGQGADAQEQHQSRGGRKDR